MNFKNKFLNFISLNGSNLTQVIQKVNAKFNSNYNRSGVYQRLEDKYGRNRLYYEEVERILDILGYELTWVKKK